MRRQINNVTDFIYFNTSSTILLKESNALEMVKEHWSKLVQKIDTYIRNGSGWSVVTVSGMSIMITKYNPMGGSSYIELPKELKSKNCLLNIKNEDQQCIMWCILESKHHQSQHAARVTKYIPYKSELNLKGVSFPTPPGRKNFEFDLDLKFNLIYDLTFVEKKNFFSPKCPKRGCDMY